MRCRDCGYSLIGLSRRARCPECGGRARDIADTDEIRDRRRTVLMRSIWIPPAAALLTILLGMTHPLLAPLVALIALISVGILAEDITRLSGLLDLTWSTAKWLAILCALFFVYGAYFLAACLASWKLLGSPFPISMY